METDVSLPCQTRVIENLFIPMPDGTRLAARSNYGRPRTP